VHLAYRCVVALLPDVDDRKRVAFARRFLKLCNGKDRSVKIKPAQARDPVLKQLQCLAKQCPLLISDEPAQSQLEPVLRRGGIMEMGLLDEGKLVRLIPDEQQLADIEFNEAQKRFAKRVADFTTPNSRMRWK